MVVEVERGRYVIAALVPEVGQLEKSRMAQGDGCKDHQPEQSRGDVAEPCRYAFNTLGQTMHWLQGKRRGRIGHVLQIRLGPLLHGGHARS
jgi:hypothetical protein